MGPPDPDATRRLGGPAGPGGPLLGGRYRLEGLLGAGGMADVHRAADLRLNRPVAVKIFRPGTDPDGEQRFHEEAQTLANLNHPGLIPVHDFGVEHHRAYLVMELVEGPTLRQVLDRERPPLEEVTRIGTEVAGVLSYVHSQGVVHRDVKPSNVLLDRNGRVRLADFGISRLVDATGITSVDAAVGTPAYMAPEQVRGDDVGPPADVYALGLVLLETVTGRQEYAGTGWEAAAARLSRAPEVPDDLPVPLHRALVAMTETDPAARPTAREAAELLAGLDTAEEDVPDEEQAGSTRGRTVAIAVGLLALLAVLAGLALAGGGDTSEVAEPVAPTTTAEDTEDVPPAEDTSADEPDPEDPGSDDTGSGDTGSGDTGSGDTGSGDPGSGDTEPTVPDLPGFEPSDLPDLPTFEAPDLPEFDVSELPDVPEVPDSVQDDARNLWQRFTDWLSGLF